jgi:hypothetical protein
VQVIFDNILTNELHWKDQLFIIQEDTGLPSFLKENIQGLGAEQEHEEHR